MNIDKDINRCKELIKTEHSNWIGMSNQDAIDNVLKELETYKTLVDKYGGAEQLEKYLVEISQALGNVTICSAKTVIEDKNEVIRCLKSELETYEKIANKLAEEIKKDVVYYDSEGICFCEIIGDYGKCFKHNKGANCIQCIIDWARKEVEKDD